MARDCHLFCSGGLVTERSIFDNISPLDHRYRDEEVIGYLSEEGYIHYKLQVEVALVRVLARRGICSRAVAQEIEEACRQVTAEEVQEEEDRIKHDVRALVNCIRRKVSDEAKPFVHVLATSCDILDSANAARYRDAVLKVLVPSLADLVQVLTDITLREAETPQIGRTHGQHAVPITFGFFTAEYVSRIVGSMEELSLRAKKLKGKFSGAVGAYNASSLFFNDPELFEAEVLLELGLQPAEYSKQIVPPEALTRLLSEVTIVAGIMANLSDDMRNLERMEIGEVHEKFEAEQVGSSTMPHKRNPINFENVKSSWKIVFAEMMEVFSRVMARVGVVFLDEICEHQRDLTNSASGRTYGEMIAYAIAMSKRLTRTMRKLTVHRGNCARNLAMQQDFILAEPLYIILAKLGHPDAHEKVRKLTLKAGESGVSLVRALLEDEEMKGYFEKMTPRELEILANPALYNGIATKKARDIAWRWKQRLIYFCAIRP